MTCPTGGVMLSANGAAIDGGSYTLNNAGYTRDIAPTLTGGTYPLVAKYAGDNSYAASTSATDTLTITPAATPLNFFSASNPLVDQTFYVQVQGSPNIVGGAAPTGTISIYDGTSVVSGPTAVNGYGGGTVGSPGFYTQMPVTLATGGDHSLTAKYSGDASYAAATSTAQIVHPLYATTSTMTVSSTDINYPQSITINATISTGQKTPVITGQINFSASNVSAPITAGPTTQSTDASGNVILHATATTTPQLSEWIYAYFPGDANYAYSSANGIYVNVNIPDFTLGPTDGVSVVPVAGQAGSAQITVTPASLTPSTVALAEWNGYGPNVIFGYTLAVSPAQVSLNGSAATATITLTPAVTIPANIVHNQARKAAFLGFGRGDWWMMSSALALGALLALFLRQTRERFRWAFGLGALCLLCLAIGCGGGAGGGDGGTVKPPGPTTITITTSNAKVAQGTPFTITATITASNALSGTVTFYDVGTAVGGGPVVNGQAQTGAGYINNIGIHQVTATYSGDAHNLTSTSSALTQVLTGTIAIPIQGSTGGNAHYIQATVGVQ
jgi:hypothetical protein